MRNAQSAITTLVFIVATVVVAVFRLDEQRSDGAGVGQRHTTESALTPRHENASCPRFGAATPLAI
jgi:hypothetical protein